MRKRVSGVRTACIRCGVLAALAPLSGGVAPGDPPGPLRWAEPGDVELLIDLHPVGSLGITYEPVVVAVRARTTLEEGLSVEFPHSMVEVWVADAQGQVLGRSPHIPAERRPPLDGAVLRTLLRPGEASRPGVYLLDRAAKLAEPGKYTVGCTLWSWTPVDRGGIQRRVALAEGTVEHEVREGTPEEYEWLASLLAFVASPFPGGRDRFAIERPALWTDPDLERPAWNLSREMLWRFGRDEIVPHLIQLAFGSRDKWTFEALRRMETDRAREALEMLATSKHPGIGPKARAELALWGQPEEGEQ